MAKRFFISINGKNRYFPTLDRATKAASRIFDRTGIVVAIVPVKGTKCSISYHFDVWGNARDGFEVNDSRSLEMDLDLSSKRSILQGLRAEFKIKPGSVRVECMGTWFDVVGRNGKPFLSIYPVEG